MITNININFIIIFSMLVNLSCKKDDYMETKKYGEYSVNIFYKNGKIVNSKTYTKEGILQTVFFYKDGQKVKSIEYYPNKKIKIMYRLEKLPNHFYTVGYYENGIMASQGSCDFSNSSENINILRRGGWIFYTKSGVVKSILFLAHDGKQEYLTREVTFDTIRKKTIKDVKYNPPLLLK